MRGMSAQPSGPEQQRETTEPTKEPAAPRRFKWPLKAIGMGLGGMILGAVIGIAIEEAVASTGVLGPGLDAVIQEQQDGFSRIDAKLDELRQTTDPQRVEALTGDLVTLMARQQELAQRTREELAGAREEIERLKEQAIDAQGATTGATLWLRAGESATIGEGQNVIGVKVVEERYNRVRVNANGKDRFMTIGDTETFALRNGAMQVILKQAKTRSDGRVGFDVVRVDEAGAEINSE